MRAKIQFLRIFNNVIYSVLEQDARGGYEMTHDNVVVYSAAYPDIAVGEADKIKIYLRGSSSERDMVKRVKSMSEGTFSAMLETLKKFSPEISVDVVRVMPMSKVMCKNGIVHTVVRSSYGGFYDEKNVSVSYIDIESVVSLCDTSKVPSFYMLSVNNGLAWRKMYVYDSSHIYCDDGLICDKSACVATKDINMSKFARCSACGEIIRNTESEIRKHLSKGGDIESCKRCSRFHLRGGNVVSTKQKHTNGIAYEIVTKQLVPACEQSYYTTEIKFGESGVKNSCCKYRLCSREKIKPLECSDLFDIPKFNQFPTIDVLREKYRGKTIGDFDNAIWSPDMHSASIPINFCDGLRADAHDGVVTDWEYSYRSRKIRVRYCDTDGYFYRTQNGFYQKNDNMPVRFAQKIKRIICASEN